MKQTTQKRQRGRPLAPPDHEYRHKRAVSLTDREFKAAKDIFGSTTKALLYALEMKQFITSKNS